MANSTEESFEDRRKREREEYKVRAEERATRPARRLGLWVRRRRRR